MICGFRSVPILSTSLVQQRGVQDRVMSHLDPFDLCPASVLQEVSEGMPLHWVVIPWPGSQAMVRETRARGSQWSSPRPTWDGGARSC